MLCLLVALVLSVILSAPAIGVLWLVGLWGTLGIWAFPLGLAIGGVSLCLAIDLTYTY